MNNNEIFVYLGLTNNVHFFIHTVMGDFNSTTIEEMCGQVYNCMIHTTMIMRNQKIAVFNIQKNGEWLVCFVDHATFSHMVDLTIEDLKYGFLKMLKAEHKESDGIMSIQYDGEKYLFYKTAGKFPTLQGLVKDTMVKVAGFSVQYTIKSITYL